jgi:anti-sigma regulatory factor (Ser/Thr protein kinase)
MEVARFSTVSLKVSDESIAGEARRSADALARQAGLDAGARGNLSVVVMEATKNLLKHAREGELLLQQSMEGDIDVLALDRGPGMADPGRCMQDGFSTVGTAGIGLGAMARMSSRFELHSSPDRGTAVFCRFSAGDRADADPSSDAVEAGVVSVPKHGERACGDGWACVTERDRTVVMVADGLGHGPLAADAAREAERVFLEHTKLAPEAILPILHDALRKTRGAAVAIAELDRARRSVRYAGAGNISGLVIGPAGAQKSMVSHNGTVGFEIRKVQSFEYPWPQDAMVIIYSDGLTSQLRLEQYNGLLARHPTLIAGVIYRDFSRQRDDATVVVLRQGRSGER